jgi:hypothetical protein
MSDQLERLTNSSIEQHRLPEVRRAFSARPIFLIVGMHGSGASMVAQMLQLLGVDMAEGGPSNDNEHISTRWERSEIVAFNDRLLETVGRPLGSAAHALPFAAGWWADPQVRSIKREIQDYLRASLEPTSSFWGFKDLRVTRLLPLWQQIFDDLGLNPIYLWTVRDPSEPIGMADKLGRSLSPAMSEVMWLIYNSEVCKYVGSEAAAVVDYQRWFQDPQTIVQTLLGRLPLSWRGSQADLLECVRAITPVDARHVPQPRMNSPLVRSLYQSISAAESEDDTEKFRASVVQAVDIVRSLVAPYASLIANGSENEEAHRLQKQIKSAEDELAKAVQRIAVLESDLELSREGQPIAHSGTEALEREREHGPVKSTEQEARAEDLEPLLEQGARSVSGTNGQGMSETVRRLELRISELEGDLEAARSRADAAEAATAEVEQALSGELQTQIAQNDWLKKSSEEQQFELREIGGRHLKAAEEHGAQLRALETTLSSKSHELYLAQVALEDVERRYREEIGLLSVELKKTREEALLQKAANERYLARIYELKAHAQSGKTKS